MTKMFVSIESYHWFDFISYSLFNWFLFCLQFIPLMLFLTANAINATFPELPDVNSFFADHLRNGSNQWSTQSKWSGFSTSVRPQLKAVIRQLKAKDEQRLETTPPNELPQTLNSNSRSNDNLPTLPSLSSNVPQTQDRPTNEQSFDPRAQNETAATTTATINRWLLPSKLPTRIKYAVPTHS